MKNPYELLGVQEDASDDLIKQAYKELAKNYNQDNYSSGPLSGIAQKKMQELNEAYDTIIMNRGSSFGSQNTYNQKTDAYQYKREARSEYNDIRATIQSGRIDDAQTLLDGIPPNMRNAEWYYLKGTVHQRRGWLEESIKNFQTACSMDPGNNEYISALNNINNSRSGGYKTAKSENSGCSGCDICSGLLCADCCCECFGGDIIPCC